MHQSLSRLAALPDATRVCCAHEYTAGQPALRARGRAGQRRRSPNTPPGAPAQRGHGLPTLPSTIAREREVNPFLRCAEPAVVEAARDHGATSDSGAAVLAALRQWKNEFR